MWNLNSLCDLSHQCHLICNRINILYTLYVTYFVLFFLRLCSLFLSMPLILLASFIKWMRYVLVCWCCNSRTTCYVTIVWLWKSSWFIVHYKMCISDWVWYMATHLYHSNCMSFEWLRVWLMAQWAIPTIRATIPVIGMDFISLGTICALWSNTQ